MNRSLLSNKVLFELEQVAQLLDRKILNFLDSTLFPWELLGSRLDDFLSCLIKDIPLHERVQGFVHPSVCLEGNDIVIEKGAVIEAGAMICGPTFVSSRATIRHSAYVRGQVYVGAGAIIGHTTETKGSIFLNEAKAAHFAYVGNSILGVDTNLGAGTKLANLRFDHGKVTIHAKVHAEELSFDTGLKKLGAILGNRAQTGCNSVTNPGTVLTAGSYLRPTELGTGIIHRPLSKRR